MRDGVDENFDNFVSFDRGWKEKEGLPLLAIGLPGEYFGSDAVGDDADDVARKTQFFC